MRTSIPTAPREEALGTLAIPEMGPLGRAGHGEGGGAEEATAGGEIDLAEAPPLEAARDEEGMGNADQHPLEALEVLWCWDWEAEGRRRGGAGLIADQQVAWRLD